MTTSQGKQNENTHICMGALGPCKKFARKLLIVNGDTQEAKDPRNRYCDRCAEISADELRSGGDTVEIKSIPGSGWYEMAAMPGEAGRD